MSKIPASVEDIVAENFEVKDVTYYPESVEFVLADISPEDSRERFKALLRRLSPMGLIPRLYIDGEKLKLTVFSAPEGREGPQGRIRLALLMCTIGTIIFSGWIVANGTIELLKEAGMSLDPMIGMLTHSMGILAFLAIHELGHALEDRRRGNYELELFVPAPPPPFGFGTFGDILLPSKPAINREEMLDKGLSGPVAGLIAALVLSFMGIMQSIPVSMEMAQSWVEQGKAGFLPTPLAFLLMELILSPQGDKVLLLSPLALSGLGAMFITFLVSMPVLPWDGGYIAFSLMPQDRARKISWLAVIGVILMNPFMGVLMLVFNLFPVHSPPLDEYSSVPESKRRRALMLYLLTLILSLPIIQ